MYHKQKALTYFKILIPDCLFTNNTQQYKVRIKGGIQGKEKRPPLHLSVVAIEKGAFWSPSTTVANFTFTFYIYIYKYIYTYIYIHIHIRVWHSVTLKRSMCHKIQPT